MSITFTPIKESDYPAILDIFNYYISNSTATFETRTYGLEDIKNEYPLNKKGHRIFLIRYQNKIAGYCFIRPFKERTAYERTTMPGIFLRPEYLRKGIGEMTLKFLETTALEQKKQLLLGYITAENEASIRLVEKLGFVKCGHFRNVAEKFNRLLDVVFYQKELG